MNEEFKELAAFLDGNHDLLVNGFLTNQATTFVFKKITLVVLPDQVLVQYDNESDERRAFEQKIIKAASDKAIMQAIHADGTTETIPKDIAVFSYCGGMFCTFHQEDNTVFTPMQEIKPIELYFNDKDILYKFCYDLIYLACDLYYRFDVNNDKDANPKETLQKKVDIDTFFDPTSLTSEVRPS